MAAGGFGATLGANLGGTVSALSYGLIRAAYSSDGGTVSSTQERAHPWEYSYSSWEDPDTMDTHHRITATNPYYGTSTTSTTGNYMPIYSSSEQQQLAAQWVQTAETIRDAATNRQHAAMQQAQAENAWQQLLRQQSLVDPYTEEIRINAEYQFGMVPARDEGQVVRVEPGSIRAVRSSEIEVVHPDKDTAEKTAQEMLKDMIGEKEIAIYNDTGRLLVRGEQADYIVQKHGLVQRIPRSKAEVIDLCVHLRERSKFPVTDQVIALKMLIENDEKNFLKTANHHAPRAITAPIPRAACAG